MTSQSADIRSFDFHCHIDLHGEPQKAIAECERNKIVTLAVTTTPKAWPQNLSWAKHSKYVHPSVGLHPELVGDRYHEVDLLEHALAQSRFVGEIGLDGSPKYRSDYERQKDVYTRALVACQKHGGRVASIHSRRAAADVIEAIEELTDSERVLCILHWFSGTLEEAKRAAAAGCYFSVNHRMLGGDRSRRIIDSLPRDRVVTETDSPFTKLNGRVCTAVDSLQTLKSLAEFFSITEVEAIELFTDTAKRIFRFAGVNILGETAQEEASPRQKG